MKTDIKVCLERTTSAFLSSKSRVELLCNVLVHSGLETKLGVEAASAEESSSVGRSIVVETILETIAAELVTVSVSKGAVTIDVRSDDSGDNIAVGEADDEAVLGCSILVLVNPNKLLASLVVSLVLTAAAESNLEALVVSTVLDDLDETLYA